jgi:hypothetical protein
VRRRPLGFLWSCYRSSGGPWVYATRNQIDVGLVRNQEGEFIRPSVQSTTAGVSALGAIPRDFRVSITNAPGKGVYPISSFTWVPFYERPGTSDEAG